MSLDLAKYVREVDKPYLKFIRKQWCSISGCKVGKPPNDPHHTVTVSTSGPDRKSIPLCRKHHTELDHLGARTFQKKYAISFDVIIEYLQKKYDSENHKIKEPETVMLINNMDEQREFDIIKDTLHCALVAVRTSSVGGPIVQLQAFEKEADKCAELMKKKDKTFRVLFIEMPDE